MSQSGVEARHPTRADLEPVFSVYEIEIEGKHVKYYGEPQVSGRSVMETIWPLFRDRGYEVHLTRELGEWVLVAEPIDLGVNGIPWSNVILLVATIVSTLFAGSLWYYRDPFSFEIIHAWPFTLAVMGVLGVHELGHYLMSRYHHVNASLPYFIPVPTLIGTMGAVIKMKGHIPNRKALFDIGVAGPLAGLAATIVITIIGLHLPPVTAPDSIVNDPDAVGIQLGYPILMEMLSMIFDQPLYYDDPATSVNPVVIGGWVGMFVTFLNLIPVGQLDGGHITRAILGDAQERVSVYIPLLLFGLAGYLYYFLAVPIDAAFIWVFWGILAFVFMFVGTAQPIDDSSLDRKRIVVGIITAILGFLCFTPVPIQIVN